MKTWDTVAIVGVGLIGGSIGMALRQKNLAKNVVGIGRRQASLRVARRVGAVSHTTIDIDKGVAEAELVIVCSPVGRIVEHVRQAARHCPEKTLITDAGSTKQSIVDALDGSLDRGCRFLGSHPLAGSEKAGAANAAADLFDGRLAILTPTKNTRAEDFDLLEQFWQSLGSVVIQMTPEEHDQALALTSHLPHMAAAALALTVPRKVLPPDRPGNARYYSGGRRRPRALAADPFAQPSKRADRPGTVRGPTIRPARRPVQRRPTRDYPLSHPRQEEP